MEPNLPELPTFEPNLPEEVTFSEWKFKETFHDNFRFLKGIMYLTKKVFML
jgi:hypothetical protein